MDARVTTCLAALALASAGGCGDSDDAGGGATTTGDDPAVTEPAPLAPAEAETIERTRAAVDSYCVHVGARVAEGRQPDPRRFARITAQVERLAALARAKPLATAPGGSTPRFALGDIAEDLEGSNCDSRLARRITDSLATVPSE